MKKIGMVFECGPQGADKQVCELLARELRSDIALRSVTLDNKAALLRDVGQATRQLLADGCCCVLVIWDLRPAWPDKKHKPCRRDERQTVLDALQSSGVSAQAAVHLICIEQELESWLLANERAISACLSTSTHAYRANRVRKPDQVKQPKAALIEHFKSARGWRYDDKVDASRVLRAARVSLPRMRQSASFARFEEKLGAC